VLLAVTVLTGCAAKSLTVEVAEYAAAGSESAVGEGVSVPARWGEVESVECTDDAVSVAREASLLWVRAQGTAPLEVHGECAVDFASRSLAVTYDIRVTAD